MSSQDMKFEQRRKQEMSHCDDLTPERDKAEGIVSKQKQ